MTKNEEEPYRRRSDPSVRPRHAVIKTLRETPNVDSIGSETPLYEHIDLEVLETLLLHQPDTDVTVTFSVLDATVTAWIDDENHVIVEVTSTTV